MPEPAAAAVPAFVPRRRPSRRNWTIASAVALVVFVWWLAHHHGGRAAPLYTFASVDTGDIEESVTATGTLEAVSTVEVGAMVSGRVVKLGADENEQVKKGQVIAVIDPEAYQARVDQADAQLAVAQAAVERAQLDRRHAERDRDREQKLGDRGVAGNADVDQAESTAELAAAAEKSAVAGVTSAEAALRSARLDLERTTIVSPIDGTVLSRPVEEGQTVTSGFQTPTLFTIAEDLGKMEVQAQIDEADVGKVVKGQEAHFTVDAHPGADYKGVISEVKISPQVTQNVVTYEAIVVVDNPSRELWPGMTATVRVVTATKKGIVRVPNGALRFKPPDDLLSKKKATGRSRRVWHLVAGKLTAVEVTLGIADDDFTELSAGALKPGDPLVTEILDADAERAKRMF